MRTTNQIAWRHYYFEPIIYFNSSLKKNVNYKEHKDNMISRNTKIDTVLLALLMEYKKKDFLIK